MCPEDILICNVGSDSILSITPRDWPLSGIQEASLVAHRVPGLSKYGLNDVLVVLLHRRCTPHESDGFMSRTRWYWERGLKPTVIVTRAHCHVQSLYAQVWEHVAPLIPEYDAPVTLVGSVGLVGSADHPWPFRLRRTRRDGNGCHRCHWSEGCGGCEIGRDSWALETLMQEETLSIDWDAEVLEQYFSSKA